jgi:hypothetical protein
MSVVDAEADNLIHIRQGDGSWATCADAAAQAGADRRAAGPMLTAL